MSARSSPSPRNRNGATCGDARPPVAPPGDPQPATARRIPIYAGGGLLLLAGIAVYANSLGGVFLFDDVHGILNNRVVQRLWPPWAWLSTERPVVSLTLAVNHALGGLEVRGYHVLNIAVHLFAGLCVYGLTRRTLETSTLRESMGRSSTVVALSTALLWVVHPLQTQSVTYIIQRGESMMGLFYLLTLYGLARGVSSRRRWAWYALSVVSCAMGMGSKAVMVSAPVAALLYDRTFLSKSFGRALRERCPLYVGLASTWGVLVACGLFRTIFAAAGDNETVGFGVRGGGSIEYARTQAGVILHYLWLCFYPAPLCLDYAWPIADWKTSIPSVAVLAAAVVATIWLLARRHGVGFLSAWFFLVLGPTSSVIPIRDAAFEHRMYLPLAAVIVLSLIAIDRLAKWVGRRLALREAWRIAAQAVLVAGIALALGMTTVRRNRDYGDELGMWRDVVAKRPMNARALVNVGVMLERRKEFDGAIDAYDKAIALKPDYPDAHFNRGVAFMHSNREEEAEIAYRRALSLSPKDPDARLYLGNLLANRHDYEGAAREYAEALKTVPRDAELREKRCMALRLVGRTKEALAECQAAIRLAPLSPDGHEALAHVFIAQGDIAAAIPEFQRVIELDAKNISAWVNLGTCLKFEGRMAEAVERYRHALALDPTLADAHYNLADALMNLGKREEAAAEFEATLRLSPNDADAEVGLGHTLRALGRAAEAAVHYQQALTLDPAHGEARAALESVVGPETPKGADRGRKDE